MFEVVRPSDPLTEIEALQDDVLRQLDELNQRLERTLAEAGEHMTIPLHRAS